MHKSLQLQDGKHRYSLYQGSGTFLAKGAMKPTYF